MRGYYCCTRCGKHYCCPKRYDTMPCGCGGMMIWKEVEKC